MDLIFSVAWLFLKVYLLLGAESKAKSILKSWKWLVQTSRLRAAVVICPPPKYSLPLPTLSSPIYNNCRVGLPLNRICVAGAGNHLSKIAAHLCSQHTTVLLVRQPVCSICCAQFVQVAVCTVQYISTQCTLHYSTHCVQCSVYYTMCNVS